MFDARRAEIVAETGIGREMTNSGDDLLARLEDMVPHLRERGQAAEQAGRIPDETIHELDEIGAFRAVVPKLYDGLEVEFPVVAQIFRILGKGCIPTGWTMGFLIYHNFQFAHFSEKAQKEVWGGRGYTMAPGHLFPSGEAIPVDGGYRLTGRWGYGTGMLHADWVLFSAPVKGGNDGWDSHDLRRFFVPIADCEILDTWNVTAMQATGSCDMRLNDVFVPEHRQVKATELISGTAPGMKINKGPLWRVPFITFATLAGMAPMIGGTEGLFEICADILKTKVGAQSHARQQELMTQQVRMARLKMDLKSAIALWENELDTVWERISGGGEMTLAERSEARMVTAYCARTCDAIANELAASVGSRSIFNDSPVQRFRREVNSLATHAFLDFDHLGSLYGQTLLGLELPPGTLL